MEVLKESWLEILIGFMIFIKVLVNVTPTEKDNKVFGWLDSIFDSVIPNYNKNGGKHS